MGGWDAFGNPLTHFERLDAGALLFGGQAVAWETLSISNLVVLSPRTNTLMAPIGDQKIIILGGWTDSGAATDGVVLDCQQMLINKTRYAPPKTKNHNQNQHKNN